MKVRAHLQDGGPSVEFYDAQGFGTAGSPMDGDPRLDLCVPDTAGISLMRSTIHDEATRQDVSVEVTDRRNDPLTQTFSERWRWTVTRRGRVARRCDDVLRLRWTYRHEMRHLFELTGYRVVAEYSDFNGEPPRYAAEQIWVVTPT